MPEAVAYITNAITHHTMRTVFIKQEDLLVLLFNEEKQQGSLAH